MKEDEEVVIRGCGRTGRLSVLPHMALHDGYLAQADLADGDVVVHSEAGEDGDLCNFS